MDSRCNSNGMSKRRVRQLIVLFGYHLNKTDCPRRMDKRQLRRRFPKRIWHSKLRRLLRSPRIEKRVIEDAVYSVVGKLQI